MTTLLTQLKPEYLKCLQLKNWDNYVTCLADEGLTWWFNMERPCIACHLKPLQNSDITPPFPLRVHFLREISGPHINLPNVDALFAQFIETSDLEAACAAAGGGVAAIWESGSNFDQFETWHRRIETLLDLSEDISPLARASMLGYKALVEHLAWGELNHAIETLNQQRIWAEKARSYSLRLFHAHAIGYCFLWAGDFPNMEITLFDAAPLCDQTDASFICKTYYKISLGFFYLFRGQLDAAKKLLDEVVGHPDFSQVHASIRLLGQSHLLLTAAFEGAVDKVEPLARQIQRRAVPDQNTFQNAYVHYNMAVASIVLSDPYKALLHSRSAMEKGRLAHSPVTERFAALVYGQALADLERREEALEHLNKWIPRWQTDRFYLLCAAGSLEIARLLIENGQTTEAGRHYRKALGWMPGKEHRPILYRPKGFFDKLEAQLDTTLTIKTQWAAAESATVRIQTLGMLKLTIDGHTIYDRQWRGGRTKTLLKALIVHGGRKVPIEYLTDLLWPDAEGDKAEQNLKVALSRLRRVGRNKQLPPINWLKVRHHQVSLDQAACWVDAIVYRDRLQCALKAALEPRYFPSILDTYTDEFLKYDVSETWIIRHREILRDLYSRGVLTFATRSLNQDRVDAVLPYLNDAVEKDPLNEGLYAALMRCYLTQGIASKAMQVYKKARSVLLDELGVEPGSDLTAILPQAGGKI